jgi:hypothetical protein
MSRIRQYTPHPAGYHVLLRAQPPVWRVPVTFILIFGEHVDLYKDVSVGSFLSAVLCDYLLPITSLDLVLLGCFGDPGSNPSHNRSLTTPQKINKHLTYINLLSHCQYG